ncbi:DUF5719 family protein [Cellulomonas hominis]|uniref:DUF5719 family protein n=1 Tax=Cellulomonas hominis TaxID=156981 RepID=UPI001B8F115E|nr:DUF5719 family protein [Cellulomonas hominis]VTR76185.1 hypothetical protein CHMI_00941 [Cellulomonas hominis]
MTADVNASDHQEPGVPTPRRSRAARVARVLSGVLVLGLTGGVVALAVAAPPAGSDPVPASTVDVPAAAATLVCPGPLQLPDDTTSGDSAFDRVPVAPNESVSAFDTGSSGTASLTPLDGAGVALDAGTGRLTSPTAPVILRAEPLDGEPARVAGATSSIVTDGDLRGLSAASCTPPTADVWLVGGSTELQSTADLVVVNPGATAADVTVEVWGPSGRVELADGGRLLVAPGAQQVVVLPGVAAEQRRTVVHVSASGGQVAAYVQDSLLDGFTPRGTDLVAGGAAPATTQVVPGLSVPGTAVDAADAGALRLLAPGDEPATVSVRLLGPDGDVVLPGAEAVDLAPGEVTDLSLGGLAAGTYTAVVESTAPVVAGGMVARTGDPGELDEQPRLERAWAPATSTGSGLVAVPAGTVGTLALGAVPTGDDSGAAPTPTPSATPTPEPTQGQRPDPAATAEPQGPAVTVTVRAHGATGVVGEQDVEVPVGSTVTLDVRRLGNGVVGVEVLAPDDDSVDVAWSLVASVSRADGAFLSVVGPLTDADAVTQAEVREGRRLGVG